MHQRFQEVARERDFLHHKAETLQMEKEEMVRSHTLETGELRKKNAYIEDQLHKLHESMDRTPMAAHQDGASGFGAATFDFESEFGIDSPCWTDPIMHDVVSPPPHPIKTEKLAGALAGTTSDPSEKPVAAPGLLLILLLCGAFVASSKTSSAQAAAALPPLPKQLQTASASVLQNIFQDAGVSEVTVGRVDTRADPSASSADSSWLVAKSDVPQMVGLESSMGVLNAAFDKASPDQQRQQFMQLTPSEYNDVTSTSFIREPEPVNQRNRRRIQENLANMRTSKASAAEVYTRSLLWDRVDAEVVRRFAAFARQAQGSGASGNEESGGAAAHT